MTGNEAAGDTAAKALQPLLTTPYVWSGKHQYICSCALFVPSEQSLPLQSTNSLQFLTPWEPSLSIAVTMPTFASVTRNGILRVFTRLLHIRQPSEHISPPSASNDLRHPFILRLLPLLPPNPKTPLAALDLQQGAAVYLPTRSCLHGLNRKRSFDKRLA